MINPGLKRATAVSFVIHMAFISLMFVSIGRRSSFVMPQPYVVSLVSPAKSQVKASRIPPAKKDIPVVEEETPPEKAVAPPKPEGVRTVEKAPPKPAEDLTKYSEEKIAALKARKERERYLEDRKSALLSKQKLAQVKRLGEAKSRVTVTARPTAGGPAPEIGQGSIVGDYIQSVRSRIEQEWVLLKTSGKDLQAIITVRVLKNGALKITDFEQTSGDAIFDRSAVRAIERASPVPPPPYEMELGVRFIPADE